MNGVLSAYWAEKHFPSIGVLSMNHGSVDDVRMA